jgi:glutathione synthase/RimK-type ligase-like ATP-grasp enzyme
LLSKEKIQIPKTLLLRFPFKLEEVQKVFTKFPLILKVATGTQGKGVMLVNLYFNKD